MFLVGLLPPRNEKDGVQNLTSEGWGIIWSTRGEGNKFIGPTRGAPQQVMLVKKNVSISGKNHSVQS